MNKSSPRLVSLMRNTLVFILFFGLHFSYAQTSSTVRFLVNFTESDPKEYKITFNTEADANGTFDYIVLQSDVELFRFRNIDASIETPFSFILVNDKSKALAGLNQQSTLTNYSNFGSEISAAFEDKAIAYIGILECTTKDGATSRLQVAKMVTEDDNISLSSSDN